MFGFIVVAVLVVAGVTVTAAASATQSIHELYIYFDWQAHHVLSEAKTRLEGSMLEGSTGDVVKGVTYIQVLLQ